MSGKRRSRLGPMFRAKPGVASITISAATDHGKGTDSCMRVRRDQRVMRRFGLTVLLTLASRALRAPSLRKTRWRAAARWSNTTSATQKENYLATTRPWSCFRRWVRASRHALGPSISTLNFRTSQG